MQEPCPFTGNDDEPSCRAGERSYSVSLDIQGVCPYRVLPAAAQRVMVNLVGMKTIE